MNSHNRLKIGELLTAIAAAEETIDKVKQRLWICDSAAIETLFRKIAVDQKTITLDALGHYARLNQTLTKAEVRSIFYRFDQVQYGQPDFNAFRPALKPFRQSKGSSQPSNYHNNFTDQSDEVQQLFLQLLIVCDQWQKEIDFCRQSIHEIAPYIVFEAISVHKCGFIGLAQLNQYMSVCRFQVEPTRLAYMLCGLRRGRYKYVTLEAFMESLYYMPKENPLKTYPDQPESIDVFSPQRHSANTPIPSHISMLQQFANENLDRIRAYRHMVELQNQKADGKSLQNQIIQADSPIFFDRTHSMKRPLQFKQELRDISNINEFQSAKSYQQNNITFAAEKARYPPLPVTFELALYKHLATKDQRGVQNQAPTRKIGKQSKKPRWLQ